MECRFVGFAVGEGGASLDEERILVVDDEPSVREGLCLLFADEGFRVLAAATAEEALDRMEESIVSAALVDIRLPGMDGIELLAEIKRRSPATEVVLMTSYASLDTAVEAIRRDAYDYIRKPFEDLEIPCAVLRRALEKRSLALRNRELLKDLESRNRELSVAVKRQKSLIDAGRAMGGILAISDLLDYFIGCAAGELGVERASLMLLDEKSGEMRIGAQRGLSEEVARAVRVKLGQGIAGWVAREGKPILVKDVESDPRIGKNIESTSAGSFISAPIVLSIPILIREKVLGVINVTNRRSGAPFEEEDMAFLFSLAGQAAVAIERARQFEELQEAYRNVQEAQKALVESERLKAIGQIAAGVAHDFNNLMMGVLGQAELLKANLSDTPPDLSGALRKVELLGVLVQQGAATVRRIQEFTRIRKDAPSGAVDMNAVMRTACEITRVRWKDGCEAQGVQIDVRMEEGPVPLTKGDEAELIQVVGNLILNAVEALSGGGEIALATRSDGKNVYLSVADNGVGMAPGVQERIFEPYFTTKERRQGLGMSVIYGIIARHQGEITVRSEEGKGTTFELRIPVAVPLVEKTPEASADAGPSGPARVLIVDDSDLNREVFENYLIPLGHEVLQAPNGKEALAIVEREPVDLVITDLSMPGLSGWDVAEGVRKRRPDVPVILVSGWAIQQEEPRIKESGVRAVLQKPLTMARLQEVVRKALDRPAANGH